MCDDQRRLLLGELCGTLGAASTPHTRATFILSRATLFVSGELRRSTLIGCPWLGIIVGVDVRGRVHIIKKMRAGADASEPIDLADLYESAACERAKWSLGNKSRSLKDWYLSAHPIGYAHNIASGRQGVQYLQLTNGQRRVGYVENQKAASTWTMQTLCSPPDNGRKGEPWHGNTTDRLLASGGQRCDFRRLHKQRVPDWHAEDMIFTFVRSPLDTAFSAYLEVSRRYDKSHPHYRNISCVSVNASTDRFEAFLAALERGKPLGGEVVHAFPQALKVHFPRPAARARRFSAIGKLESLTAHLEQMRWQLAGAQPPEALSSNASRSVSARGFGTTKSQPCHKVDWQRRSLMQRLCRVYRADFICFNYSLPKACVAMGRDVVTGTKSTYD